MIRIDFSRETGVIKALHGVDNAPVRPNGQQKEFREAGIPFVRTHDTAGMWGGTHYVDIPNVFPDFNADENDPASYDFTFTDAYLKPLVEAGAMPFYRLGVTIENYYKIKAYHIAPPEDFRKWAGICEHVVRHYTQGWADGFNWDVRYWEIWNEPENPPMWSGTREQFFELYRVAATHLKQCFPSIRVGGYGGCGFYAIDGSNTTDFYKSFVTWFEDFCVFVRGNGIPLDFYSWHLYTTDPHQIITHADYVRGTLDRNGLRNTESIFNEWNYINWQDPNIWDTLKELPGAAFVASAFCLMQKGPVDKAMYYDATPSRSYCGLFYSPSQRVTPCYHAFKAFNTLYRLGTEVESESGEPEVFICAAKDANGGKAFLLVNNKENAVSADLCLNGAEPGEFTLYRLDPENRMLNPAGAWEGGTLTIPGKSVFLFRNSADGDSAVQKSAPGGKFAGLDGN